MDKPVDRIKDILITEYGRGQDRRGGLGEGEVTGGEGKRKKEAPTLLTGSWRRSEVIYVHRTVYSYLGCS